jgi:hypothetical protein
MEPLTASIVVILGKYALDKGVELGKEVGPQALDTAKEMFAAVLDRLRKDPKGEVIAGEYEKDPETYEKPVGKALDGEVQADAEFMTQLQALLARYEALAGAHAAATGGIYQATVTTGAGGVAVGRDVHGGVHLSGRPEREA